MKRCLHLISAFLLVSLVLSPFGEVYATGARAEREIRTDVPMRTAQHLERHSEPNTTKLGLREGHELDGETGLYYMGARYYEPKVKRFLSQDPAHLLVGDYRFEDKFGVKLTDHIANPQKLNTYTYTINNPLRFKDEQGAIPVDTVLDVGMAVYDVGDLGYNLWQGDMEGAKGSLKNLALDLASIALPYVSFSGAKGAVFIAGIAKKVTKGGGGSCLNCVSLVSNAFEISKKYNWGSSKTLQDHFVRHGGDFGARSMSDYASKAQKFFTTMSKPGVSSFEDSKGVIRMYDKRTNTFGSYDADGATKTFFKPDAGEAYWKEQKKKYGP